MDDNSWAICHLVVETGHWFSRKEIVISPKHIDRISYEESKVFVNVTKEAILEAPQYHVSPLGEEYGDYARKPASALEEAANKVSAKNPDELIDDTREFVRKSPGVALAGAAIIGFALVRLVKSGLDQGRDNDED